MESPCIAGNSGFNPKWVTIFSFLEKEMVTVVTYVVLYSYVCRTLLVVFFAVIIFSIYTLHSDFAYCRIATLTVESLTASATVRLQGYM